MVAISDIYDLDNNQAFDGEFVVSEIAKKPFRNKEGFFLLFNLSDATGKIQAKIWEIPDRCDLEEDSIFYIKGRANLYKGKNQAVVNSFEKLTIFDKSKFIPKSKRSVEELISEFNSVVKEITDPDIKKFVEAYTKDQDFMLNFIECPGGKGDVHHTYIHGLLEHTTFVMKVSAKNADIYQADKSMAIAGAFIHDLGKIESYSYKTTIKMTDAGRLEGHLPLGYVSFQKRLEETDISKERKVELKLLLGHIILSHHGGVDEHKESTLPMPMTVEAMLVAKADGMDAGIIQANRMIDESDEDWSEYDKTMGKYYFRKGNGEKKKAEAEEVEDVPMIKPQEKPKQGHLFDYKDPNKGK